MKNVCRIVGHFLTSVHLLIAGGMILVVGVAGAVQIFEDFENMTDVSSGTSYVDMVRPCASGNWQISGVVSTGSAGDRRNGARSVRMRGQTSSSDNHFIQMNFDKPDGIGNVTFKYGSYAEHSQGQLQVEYSIDAGVSWQAVGGVIIAPSWTEVDSELQTAIVSVVVNAPARIRVRKISESSEKRIVNVDDITIGDYLLTTPIITQVPPQIIVAGYKLIVPVAIASGNGEPISVSVNANHVVGAYGFNNGAFTFVPDVADIGSGKEFVVTAVNSLGASTMTIKVDVSPPPTFFEDFENFLGGSTATFDDYVNAERPFGSGSWQISGRLAMAATDRYNGVRGVRLRGQTSDDHFVQMNFDKQRGVGIVTFKYAAFSTHSECSLYVEYSDDGGMSWVRANSGNPVIAHAWNGVIRDAFVPVKCFGNVRIRIVKAPQNTTSSVTIDDIAMTDFTVPPTMIIIR